jgi:hypothetical protein
MILKIHTSPVTFDQALWTHTKTFFAKKAKGAGKPTRSAMQRMLLRGKTTAITRIGRCSRAFDLTIPFCAKHPLVAASTTSPAMLCMISQFYTCPPAIDPPLVTSAVSVNAMLIVATRDPTSPAMGWMALRIKTPT